MALIDFWELRVIASMGTTAQMLNLNVLNYIFNLWLYSQIHKAIIELLKRTERGIFLYVFYIIMLK